MLYCSTGVSNIVRFKDNEGRRVVQFDIHEKAVLFGFYDTGNITFQVTTKEKEKNTAAQTTASLMNGMLQTAIKNSTCRILKVELCWKTMHHLQHLVFSQELL